VSRTAELRAPFRRKNLDKELKALHTLPPRPAMADVPQNTESRRLIELAIEPSNQTKETPSRIYFTKKDKEIVL
jgi:hypothetical protein